MREKSDIKQIGLRKVVAMAFIAPAILMILYIFSLSFRATVPPLLSFILLSVFVLVPIEMVTLLRANKKETGYYGLQCSFAFHEKVNVGKMILYVIALFLIAGVATMLIGKLEDLLFMPLIQKYIPDYFLAEGFINQLSDYPRATIVVTVIAFVLANSFILPISEELYFQGYMLPRLERFGKATPLIVTSAFSLYHFWSPWQNIRRIFGIFPYVYMDWKKKNIMIGILVHVTCNLISSIEIISLLC